jgi:putative transposase
VGAGDSPAQLPDSSHVPQNLHCQNRAGESPASTRSFSVPSHFGTPPLDGGGFRSNKKAADARLSLIVQRKYEYRRNLPHYQKDNRILFITYSTWQRWTLPEIGRDLALESCLRANGRKYSLYAAVVMPDHVHVICLPRRDEYGEISIPEITRTIKSESAHRINKALGRTGRVWQDESFDHVLRGDESLRKKVLYILENPVRAGLVAAPGEYRWLWWDEKLISSVA